MKYVKSFVNGVKHAYKMLTGETGRQSEKLRREFAELREKVEELGVTMRDRMALTKFSARKASEYFNERAAREPEQAAEYQRLAKLAATVDTEKMRGVVSAYGAGEEDVKEWHLTRDRYRDELNKHTGKKIDEFITEDPARWERLKKQFPDVTEALKP